MQLRPICLLLDPVEVAAALLPRVGRAYLHYHEEPARVGIRCAQITRDSRVLVVGGGPAPHTATRIALETGAQVEVIDNSRIAVWLARRMLQRFGAGSRVNVTFGHGLYVDVAPYDVVLVVTNVSPKNRVVKHVVDGARDMTRVIVRNPPERLARWQESVDFQDLSGCEITEMPAKHGWHRIGA